MRCILLFICGCSLIVKGWLVTGIFLIVCSLTMTGKS